MSEDPSIPSEEDLDLAQVKADKAIEALKKRTAQRTIPLVQSFVTRQGIIKITIEIDLAQYDLLKAVAQHLGVTPEKLIEDRFMEILKTGVKES